MHTQLLWGPSAAATKLEGQVARVAGTPRTTVLLRGARGIELELVGRAIHERSDDPAGPFVRVDCARIITEDVPLAAQAGGTFFLEEVTDLDPVRQQRLVATLEERAARTDAPTTARLIASTAADLEHEVEEGRFREDLFYRLNVLTVRVPALSERADDLAPLCEALLDGLRGWLGGTLRLTAEALRVLAEHDWPGGLLELRAVLTCGALAARPGTSIEPTHLAGALGKAASASDALIPLPPRAEGRVLREVEEAAIRRILSEVEGNRSQAARTLGINRTTLYNKMRQYGIQ